jgi:branched-chain amino acid transport system substrate-binding protein
VDIPLLTTETVVDQSNLRSMDDNAIGIISAGHYAEGLQTPANQEFVQAFQERTGRLPSYFAAAMYSAAEWIVQAIEAVDGDVSDRAAFQEAVRSVQVEDSPLGRMYLDEYHHTTQDIYIRRVEKRPDGLLWNAVVETIPEVSQFWTYDPEEYLAHPAYSRTYQGNGVWPDPQE